MQQANSAVHATGAFRGDPTALYKLEEKRKKTEGEEKKKKRLLGGRLRVGEKSWGGP